MVPRRLPERVDDVDRLFYWCWSEVAQHIPDANPSSSSGSECDAVSCPRSPRHLGLSLDGAWIVSGLPTRFLTVALEEAEGV